MTIDEAIEIVQCLRAFEDSEQEALDAVLTALTDLRAQLADAEGLLKESVGMWKYGFRERVAECLARIQEGKDGN